jgi:hypothetical protein
MHHHGWRAPSPDGGPAARRGSPRVPLHRRRSPTASACPHQPGALDLDGAPGKAVSQDTTGRPPRPPPLSHAGCHGGELPAAGSEVVASAAATGGRTGRGSLRTWCITAVCRGPAGGPTAVAALTDPLGDLPAEHRHSRPALPAAAPRRLPLWPAPRRHPAGVHRPPLLRAARRRPSNRQPTTR